MEKHVIDVPGQAVVAHDLPLSSESTLVEGASKTSKKGNSEDLIADLEKHERDFAPRNRRYSQLRYTVLNVYRRLFSLVFIANIVAFLVVAKSNRTVLNFVNGAAANLLVCGLARQPLVVNCLYLTLCSIPRSAPVRIRRIASKVFHYGGVHSGCGVASCLWYISFVGVLTREDQAGVTPTSGAVIVVAYLIVLLLVAMIVVAHPTFRIKHHNWFEWTHRLLGWTVVALLWALLLDFSSMQRRAMESFLVRQPSFWMIIVVTVAIVQPWIMLRRVAITPEVLSKHASRLHFDYTSIKFGQGISIAKHPLRDWHSFATFPDRFDSPDTKFSWVVSKAGDWTEDMILNPPTHVWKRAVPLYGYAKVMCVFKKILIVTTGSGIGPCLSFLADGNRPKMRVLWQTRTPEIGYGQKIIDLVHQMDPNPLIWDSEVRGRVDMLPVVIEMYREFEAEAVCVISNPRFTKKLVFDLESRGICASGPIFDS